MKLKETIYGNKAIVFHRSQAIDLIDSIKSEGFLPGSGAMYGKGFYATYELESQLEPGMRDSYGDHVYKFAVDISKYFFFDYEEFEKTPQYREWDKSHTNNPLTVANFIELQLRWYHIIDLKMEKELEYNKDLSNTDIKIKYEKLLKEITKTLNTSLMKGKYSSDAAKIFTDTFRYYNLEKNIRGIVFTGRSDGKVLVAYDTKTITPLSKVDLQDEEVYYEISEYIGVIDKYSDSLDILYEASLASFSLRGNYESAESDTECISNLSLFPIGFSFETPYELSYLKDLDFNLNGSGLYLEYINDHTPEKARDNAYQLWGDKIDSNSSDFDEYNVLRAIDSLLDINTANKSKRKVIDYIIVKNISIDNIMKDILWEYLKSNSVEYDDFRDTQGNEYVIYWQSYYDITKDLELWRGNPGEPGFIEPPNVSYHPSQMKFDFGM